MWRDRQRFCSKCSVLLLLLFTAIFSAPSEVLAQNVFTNRLQHAAQFLAAGDKVRAEDILQSVLRASPNEYRALDLLGVVRILQHRENDAGDLFRRVVQIKPEFASGHAHLGLLYVQTGRLDEAVPELSEAVRLDPARTDALDALVRIWRDQAQAAAKIGDSSAAMALLIDARKLAPKNADVQFEFGMAALQMSLWEDASGAFQQSLHLHNNDPMVFWGLGRAFMGESKFEEARQQFASYVALRPADSAGHCALGMTFAALQQSTEARAQFEQSIALEPAQTESYYRLGQLYLDSKDLDSAGKNLLVVLERDPKHAGALAALGRIDFERKQYTEAIDLLQRAIANDETLSVAHYYLGLSYSRMGRKAESDQELQRAVRLEQQGTEKQRTIFKIADPGSASAPDTQPQK
jgi:tetratricopeptide (TPR) repeat protein